MTENNELKISKKELLTALDVFYLSSNIEYIRRAGEGFPVVFDDGFIEKEGRIRKMEFSKNRVEYSLNSTRRFDAEYALGDVIISLAEVLRLVGVSNPLNASILAMEEMKPKDYKLMLKFLKRIEERFARTRAQIERYLEYQ